MAFTAAVHAIRFTCSTPTYVINPVIVLLSLRGIALQVAGARTLRIQCHVQDLVHSLATTRPGARPVIHCHSNNVMVISIFKWSIILLWENRGKGKREGMGGRMGVGRGGWAYY